MKKSAAVIGYGGMGNWHTERLLKSDVFELAGIYDSKKDRRALAESRGIRAYATREELLADPRVDLLTIVTPNDMHEEIAVAAMRAGKNVIVEKPVTLTMESLERMIAVSGETGKIFTAHQNRRFDADHLAIKQIHDAGDIGEIVHLESRIHGSRGIPSDWRGLKQYGGGMLFDWGIHLIDQALITLGWDVDSVDCREDHLTNGEVDDGFQLTITLKSGKRAYVEVGTLNFIPMPRFYMRGRKGTAMITDWREEAQVVRCDHWHESEVVPVETAAGLTKTMAPRDSVTTTTYSVPRPTSDVHDFYRNVAAAIDGREKQLVTHEQMRIDLKVILCAKQSARTGKTVKF